MSGAPFSFTQQPSSADSHETLGPSSASYGQKARSKTLWDPVELFGKSGVSSGCIVRQLVISPSRTASYSLRTHVGFPERYGAHPTAASNAPVGAL